MILFVAIFDLGKARAEPTDWSIVFCLAFSFLRHLGRLIFLLILPRTLPAQINNKRNEAQQPPSNPFCGVQVLEKFHWNLIIATCIWGTVLGSFD